MSGGAPGPEVVDRFQARFAAPLERVVLWDCTAAELLRKKDFGELPLGRVEGACEELCSQKWHLRVKSERKGKSKGNFPTGEWPLE